MFWRKHYISKHTGKEIDDAVDAVQALPEDVIGNPMTAAGDLIVGGTDGEPAKLAAGSSGQVLKIGASGPEWATDAAGMENPMTTAGDIIVGGASGAPARLAAGSSGQVLKIGASGPEWATDAGGMENPMTTAGDLIVGGTDGAANRLGVGTAGQILKVNSDATGFEYGHEKIYSHNILLNFTISSVTVQFSIMLFNTQSTAFTSTTFTNFMIDNTSTFSDIKPGTISFNNANADYFYIYKLRGMAGSRTQNKIFATFIDYVGIPKSFTGDFLNASYQETTLTFVSDTVVPM